LGVSIKILTEIDDPIFFTLVSLVFFSVGFVYFLICGVENWFYNLFADYVKECNRIITKSRNAKKNEEQKLLPTLNAFTGQHSKNVSPEHTSFIPFLSVIAIGNNSYVVAIPLKLLSNSFLSIS